MSLMNSSLAHKLNVICQRLKRLEQINENQIIPDIQQIERSEELIAYIKNSGSRVITEEQLGVPIIFTAPIFQKNIGFDLETNTFTIQEDGLYSINLSGNITGSCGDPPEMESVFMCGEINIISNDNFNIKTNFTVVLAPGPSGTLTFNSSFARPFTFIFEEGDQIITTASFLAKSGGTNCQIDLTDVIMCITRLNSE